MADKVGEPIFKAIMRPILVDGPSMEHPEINNPVICARSNRTWSIGFFGPNFFQGWSKMKGGKLSPIRLVTLENDKYRKIHSIEIFSISSEAMEKLRTDFMEAAGVTSKDQPVSLEDKKAKEIFARHFPEVTFYSF